MSAALMVDGARFVKRVGERGTVTLPADVRDILGVKEGDLVEFEILRVVRKDAQAPSGPTAAPTPIAMNQEGRST